MNCQKTHTIREGTIQATTWKTKKGEEAKLQVVKTGIQDDSNIQVISGLEDGDEVITGPYNIVTKVLESGDKVEVQSANKK